MQRMQISDSFAGGRVETSHTHPIALAAKEDQDFQASWLHVTRRLHNGRQESPSKYDCRRW